MKTARLRTVERLVGAVTVLLGTVVLVGWTLDAPALKSVLPGLAPMKANTALGFILSGVAFWLGSSEAPTKRARLVASACSALVLVGCGLTLFQYLSGWNLGLDQALFKDALSSSTHPGRMAPNTAVAFVFLSTALRLSLGERNRARRTTAGLLSSLTALLGLFAVTSHLGDGTTGYGWSESTTTALPAGAAFMLLGTAGQALAWRGVGFRVAVGGRLLTVFVLGLAAFVALGALSYQSTRRFAEAADWLRHTFEVLATLQEARSDITELKTTVRGFVVTGREDFLAPYQGLLERLDHDARTLRRLTADNPIQQARLTTLEELIEKGRAFSSQSVDLGRHPGLAAMVPSLSTAQVEEIMNQIGLLIAGMQRTEHDLLAPREANARALTLRTFAIRPLGTLVGLGVLLTVFFFLNLEATERFHAEAARRNAAAIVESTDDAVITKTLDGIITGWNPGAERIFGYAAHEAIGRPVLMLIPPERATDEQAILSHIARGERVESFETVRLRKDGRRIDVSVTISPLRDPTRKIVGASKILRDITQRKATAEALQDLGLRLTTTLENMDAAFFTVDRGWHFTYLNKECERLLHCTRDQLLGKVLWEEFQDAIGGPSDLNYHLAMSEKRAVSFEEFYPPLGMWLEVRAYPSSDGLAVYFRDVTERKRGAAELLESQARLAGIVTSAMDAIITIDSGHRIVLFNQAAEKMFRCAAQEVIGEPLDRFIPSRFHAVHARHVEQFGAAGVTSRSMGALGALSGVRSEGEEFPIEASISQVEVAGQKLFTVILRDITERRSTERALRESEERFRFLNADLEQRVIDRTAELEAANRELEAFSYSVSHDLRAPLRTIDGFSQALVEDFGPLLPEDGRRQVRTIREGAQRMGALIDDLLAFSRLGRQSLSKRTAVDMNGLVRDALEDLVPDRQDREIEIRVGPLAACIGDPAMVKQVWANLLSNAIKYTRKRNPAVVEVGCESPNGETVYFVRDNGTGFDMRYAGKLFGVFQRLHRAEDFEGTGVGLAIVQRIVQRHGGRVWADSIVDRGATFHFTLSKGAA